MIDDVLRFTTADIYAFLTDKGVPAARDCPMCRSPNRFGVQAADSVAENWTISATDEGVSPMSDNFFEYCGNCGFTQVYYLKPFRAWLRARWGS